MRKTLLVVSLAACAAIVFSSSLLAAETWLGTWKLDPAKSKVMAAPGPKSQTLKFEKTADGIKLTSDGVNAEGKPTHGEYVSMFDGKDVPWTGNPDADMASPKRIDDHTYKNTWKMGGKATITAKVVVSADGKTLTIINEGANAKGQAVHSTFVYIRQ